MKKVSTKAVLRAAREIIEQPTNWWDGKDDGVYDQECAANAILIAAARSRGEDQFEYKDAVEAFTSVVGGHSIEDIWKFNDSHSHGEVLAVFDAAIEGRG